MRIVLFNYTGAKPNPVYDILAAALAKRGHVVIVGATDENSKIVWYNAQGEILGTVPTRSEVLGRLNIPIVSAILARVSKIGLMQQVRHDVLAVSPDIIQVNTNVNPWILALNLPRGVQATYDIRQINESVDERLRTRIQEKLQLYRYRIFTRYIFKHSFFCHREAARHIVGEDWPHKVSVIPVGVDNAFLEIETSQLANKVNGEPLNFVYVGTLSRLRNLQQLFYAADILRQEMKGFKITLVGPDRSNGFYQHTIDELNLNEYVAIEPPLPYEAVPTFLANQHVGLAFVPDRPTWHYQPTIKILEYRALGLPILSTDVASHREFIQDGVNGVMVQDNPESIAAGMRRFLQDGEFFNHMVSNARQMRRGLTWDQIAEAYEHVYQQLLLTDRR
jgi:glycosyltransferase involved in cell wall biosynthesis